MLLLCAIGAAPAIRRIVALTGPAPTGSSQFANLDGHFASKTGPTLLHVLPSLAFILLVPLQFVSTLRLRHPRVHRWMGRLLMCLGLVIGVSAVSLSADPVGGIFEGSATALYGCLFLLCLSRAWWYIRSSEVERHREWVIRMVSIALGAATTRPIIGVLFATSRLTGLSPQQFFGPAMWLGFTATYLAGEIWIRYTRSRGIGRHGQQMAVTTRGVL
jgi:hypothetical protein